MHSGLAAQDQLDSAVPGLNSTSLLVCSDMLHAYLLSTDCDHVLHGREYDDEVRRPSRYRACLGRAWQAAATEVRSQDQSCEKPSLRALAAGVCVAVRRLDIDSGVSCSMQ